MCKIISNLEFVTCDILSLIQQIDNKKKDIFVFKI